MKSAPAVIRLAGGVYHCAVVCRSGGVGVKMGHGGGGWGGVLWWGWAAIRQQTVMAYHGAAVLPAWLPVSAVAGVIKARLMTDGGWWLSVTAALMPACDHPPCMMNDRPPPRRGAAGPRGHSTPGTPPAPLPHQLSAVSMRVTPNLIRQRTHMAPSSTMMSSHLGHGPIYTVGGQL